MLRESQEQKPADPAETSGQTLSVEQKIEVLAFMLDQALQRLEKLDFKIDETNEMLAEIYCKTVGTQCSEH